ncbi:MAG: response regulator [Mediterranea sp.]|nr:response regulator [Mediterranea sp.]
MKAVKRTLLIILLWLAIGVAAHADTADRTFDLRHIGYAEGLSSQRVFSIVEDEYGAMWIGTKVGVDRYNGHSVKNYTLPDSFYYGDLAARQIYLLYDVRYGLLAYDQTGRVYCYSADEDGFKLILHIGQSLNQTNVILNKLFRDREGALWIGLDRGLYKQEAEGKPVQPVMEGRYVNDIVDGGESVFVGTTTGIWEFTLALHSRARLWRDGINVQTLYCDRVRQELWVGMFAGGLGIMRLDTGVLAPAENLGDSHPIRAITNYDSRTMLIGVDGGGVYAMGKVKKELKLLVDTGDKTENYLRGNGVYAVTRDRQGNIWVGSYTGGVSVAILSRSSVAVWRHERGNTQSLGGNNVNDIEENTDGQLWFGIDGGISILNRQKGQWRHVLHETVVVSLCPADDGRMWAGTYGNGVLLLDADGNILRQLTKQGGELVTNYIFSVRQDADGDLWIGALDGELMLLPKDGSQMRLYDVKWVQSIEPLDSGRVAVATVDGFRIVDKRTGDVRGYATSKEFYDQNVSAYIIAMLFNSDGTVWLGTEGGGLNRYDPGDGKVVTLTTREGLPSNDIYGLLRDDRGRLWVSTGKGIAVVDSLRVSNINYVGDIDKEYNKSSLARLRDGEFVFGSTDGAVFIMPLAISTTDYQAPLRFTGLTVDYSDEGERAALAPSIHRMVANGSARLDYRHNSFDLTFESINYRYQRDIAYQYMLEGYDKDWSEPSADGRARYTKVSPGDYVFRVRSLRRSSGKGITEATLAIEVTRPWWNSWWAWTFYVAMALALLYFAWRYKSNQLQKRYSEEKIRFFVDTAHDIRTPLTLVMAPLEDLGREEGLPGKARYYLDLAHEGASKLQALIARLLEFEKMDARNSPAAMLAPVDLHAALADEAAAFRAVSEKKRLRLNLSLPDEPVYALADRQLVETLLDNLLSNACKYTPAEGNVDLCLTATRKRAVVTVSDSGIGIPKAARRHIFTDIYRADNARLSSERGTGFGLLQVHRIVRTLRGKIAFRSEEGRGTTFVVTLRRAQPAASPSPHEAPTGIAGEPRAEAAKAGEPDTDRYTLLIVEDHEALRYYLRQTFEDDYRVVDAADGEEALAYLTDEYPDLILSDVMMPGIQGDELCRLVKENPDTAGIPFVLLTAKTNHDAVVEGLRKGADDYIPKPFSTEILKLKVCGLLENRHRQRAFFMRQAIARVEEEGTKAGEDNQLADTTSEGDRQFILRATQLILDRLSDTEFSINTLCREMAMSRTLFYSRLKALTGQGPQEFIRIIRLQRAAELLKEGKSVADVATQTGFVNVKYFSSLFKKQFGMQPSRYGEG